MNAQPITDDELTLLEQAARSNSPSRLNKIVLDLVAEVRRLHLDADSKRIDESIDHIVAQNEIMREAFYHLKQVIAAYHTHPNVGPLINTARAAAWWYGHLYIRDCPADNEPQQAEKP